MIASTRRTRRRRRIEHHVVIEHASIAATVHARAGIVWMTHAVVAGETIDLPAIGVSFSIADCYEGIELPQLDEDDGRPPVR